MSHTEIKKPVSIGGGPFAAAPAAGPVNWSDQPIPGVARTVLLGVAESGLAQRLKTELGGAGLEGSVRVASNLSHLRELASSPVSLIFLDTDLLGGKPLSESLPQLAAIAPVLVLASVERQTEVAKFVALGNVEFVARMGDYLPLVVALIERRLKGNGAQALAAGFGWPPFSEQMGEIFRHEINNPLTGILGNAELVLAHAEHLSPQEVQRLQTVVDLAVRLRETIRRISNAWERNLSPTPSA